jgi:hypothetical protein
MDTQEKRLLRMERETRREMRKLEDFYTSRLLLLWSQARTTMEGVIMREYRRDFDRRRWDITAATSKGTLHRIMQGVDECLAYFLSQAANIIYVGRKVNKKQEIMRQLWMLDQLSPPSRIPLIPVSSVQESLKSPTHIATWQEALAAWLQSYRDGLKANLRMEALGSSSLMDAADEVSSTRVDGFDPAYKLESLATTEILRAQAAGRADVAYANGSPKRNKREADVMGGMVAEEIWQTMEDGRVCPDCDELDGETIAHIGEEPPLHPRCRCFARLVPKEWAAMLRSGDPDEKEAALRMEDEGLVQDAMAIRSASGELVAHAVVSFSDWLGERAANAYGMNIVGRVQ